MRFGKKTYCLFFFVSKTKGMSDMAETKSNIEIMLKDVGMVYKTNDGRDVTALTGVTWILKKASSYRWSNLL